MSSMWCCLRSNHASFSRDDIDWSCIPHFPVYVDDVDQPAADLRAAGVDTFQTAEKCVMPNTFGGLENWFFTGPSGEQIELLRML